jgi:hypothetical protein
VTWQTLEVDTFDSDYLTPTEQRLAETLPPVPKGGRRQLKEPQPEIVRLEDVKR